MRKSDAGLIAVGLLGLAIVLSSCASRQSLVKSAGQGAAVAYEATNAARVAFTDWELKQRPEDAPGTYEEVTVLVLLHEKRVKRVSSALAVAYASIAAVVQMLPLVDAGKRKPADLLAALVQAVAAAEQVRDAVKEAVHAP